MFSSLQLLTNVLPFGHIWISKSIYLVLPLFLEDTYDSKDWSLSRPLCLLFIFTGNNVMDTLHGYFNFLWGTRIAEQHFFQLTLGLLGNVFYVCASRNSTPLWFVVAGSGLAGYSYSINCLEVYIRQLCAQDIELQTETVYLLQRNIPFYYALSFVLSGFIYEYFGIEVYAAIGCFLLLLTSLCLVYICIDVAQLEEKAMDEIEIHQEVTEKENTMVDEIDEYWSSSFMNMLLVRGLCCFSLELYLMIYPSLLYEVASPGVIGTLNAIGLLWAFTLMNFATDLSLEKLLLHYPYPELLGMTLCVVSVFSWNHVRAPAIKCTLHVIYMSQVYFSLGHLDAERNIVTPSKMMTRASSVSSMTSTSGFLLGASLGSLALEFVGFERGFYICGTICVVNILVMLYNLWYAKTRLITKLMTLEKKLRCRTDMMKIHVIAELGECMVNERQRSSTKLGGAPSSTKLGGGHVSIMQRLSLISMSSNEYYASDSEGQQSVRSMSSFSLVVLDRTISELMLSGDESDMDSSSESDELIPWEVIQDIVVGFDIVE